MFLLLLAVWIILNGKITVEICVLGALISAALFYFMCRYMEYGLRKELLLFRLTPLFIRYFWVLVKEIVRANVCVLKIIVSPELEPEPAFVYFDVKFRTGMAKVMLADSITLTPGTITVDVKDDVLWVHALTAEMAEGLKDWHVARQLARIEEVR